jgi:hypothetical protein
VTIARVLWPRLPQNELKEATARFCDAAKLALDENSEVSMSSIHSTLSTLPLDIARTTAALGVNRLLRQEQAKWNRLVPILISLSAQLPRLTSIRAKVADSQEVRLYLDSFHQDFGSWMEAALLPSVSPTIDWVRLPQRFPVRIQVDSSAPTELRIGQTASVAISHGARIENTRIPE